MCDGIVPHKQGGACQAPCKPFTPVINLSLNNKRFPMSQTPTMSDTPARLAYKSPYTSTAPCATELYHTWKVVYIKLLANHSRPLSIFFSIISIFPLRNPRLRATNHLDWRTNRRNTSTAPCGPELVPDEVVDGYSASIHLLTPVITPALNDKRLPPIALRPPPISIAPPRLAYKSP